MRVRPLSNFDPRSVEDKGIKMSLDLDEICQATIDVDHLALVVRNVISNALKFTPEGGEIKVSLESSRMATILRIKDSGKGLSQEEIDQINEGAKREKLFSTLGTKGEKGTGLGLFFSKEMLALNDAELQIKSRSDDGAEVSVIMKP